MEEQHESRRFVETLRQAATDRARYRLGRGRFPGATPDLRRDSDPFARVRLDRESGNPPRSECGDLLLQQALDIVREDVLAPNDDEITTASG